MSKGFSEEEVAQFQETFNMYDADGGGKWLHIDGGLMAAYLTVMAYFFDGSKYLFLFSVARQAAIIIYLIIYYMYRKRFSLERGGGYIISLGCFILSFFLWDVLE